MSRCSAVEAAVAEEAAVKTVLESVLISGLGAGFTRVHIWL